MAQNITTLLDKTEITAEEIEAAQQILNYLYIVHGTGSGRSRRIELGELKKLMSVLSDVTFDSITMQKGVTGGAAEAVFDGESIHMNAKPAGVTDSGEMYVNRLGISFTTNPSSTRQDSSSMNSEGFEVSGVRDGEEKVTKVKYNSILTPHVVAVDANLTGKSIILHPNFTVNEANSTFHTAVFDDMQLKPSLGELVVIKNTSAGSIEIVLEVVGAGSPQSKVVSVERYCSIMLVCTGTYQLNEHTYHSWTPVGNYTVSFHN